MRLLSPPWQCRTQQDLAWASQRSWLTRIPRDHPCPGGETLSWGCAISSHSQICGYVPFRTGVWISISCWCAVVACLGCLLLHGFALPPCAVSLSLPLHRWTTVGHNSFNSSSPSHYPAALLLGRWWKGLMSETPWRARPPPESPPSPTNRSNYSSLSLSWIVLRSCFLSTISLELFCRLSPGSLLPVILFLPLSAWLLMRAIWSTCHFIRQEQTRCTREKNIPILFVGDWAMCFQISAHMYCHWFMFLRTTLSFAYRRLWFFQALLCLRLQLGFMFMLWNMFPICICHCYLMKKLNIASVASSSNGSILICVLLTDFLFRLW